MNEKLNFLTKHFPLKKVKKTPVQTPEGLSGAQWSQNNQFPDKMSNQTYLMPILQKVTFEYSNFIFFNYFQPYSNIPKAKVSVRGIFLLYKTLFPRQFFLSILKLNYTKDTFASSSIF